MKRAISTSLLTRPVGILSLAEIRIRLITLNDHQESNLSTYVSALLKITGLCVARNDVLQLLSEAEDNDELELEKFWSKICIIVENLDNMGCRRSENTVHLAHKTLGLIVLAVCVSRSQAEAAELQFNKLKMELPSVVDSCLIYIKSEPYEDIVVNTDDSEVAVFDKNCSDLVSYLEKQLAKVVYSIILKLQVKVMENNSHVQSSDVRSTDTTVLDNSLIEQQKKPQRSISHKTQDDLLEDEQRSKKLHGDVLLILGLVDLAAKKYYNIIVSDKKLLKPFWVAAALECLCCCYLLSLFKKYSIWPSESSIRVLEHMRPEILISSKVLDNKILLNSAKLYYNFAAFVWSFPDISKNILYLYRLSPSVNLYLSSSASQAASVHLYVAQFLLAVAQFGFERKFVKGASFTLLTDTKNPKTNRTKDTLTNRTGQTRKLYYYNQPIAELQSASIRSQFLPWNFVEFSNIALLKVDSNDPYLILRLEDPPDKNPEPHTPMNDAASWIENLYLINFNKIPFYERTKLEDDIIDFYLASNYCHKLALFSYITLKEYLKYFLNARLVQLPGGELTRSNSLQRTDHDIRMSSQALRHTKLIYELLSPYESSLNPKQLSMLAHIMNILNLFSAFNNKFELAANITAQIMDKFTQNFSWAAQSYLLDKLYAFSRVEPLKTVKLKQELWLTVVKFKGCYNKDKAYSSIFGNIIIKSLKILNLEKNFDLQSNPSNKGRHCNNSNKHTCNYMVAVGEVFYLEIVVDNGFPFDVVLEKIIVNTTMENEVKVLPLSSRIAYLSSSVIHIPIIPLKRCCLTLKELVFVLFFGGLECTVPIIDIANQYLGDQIRIHVVDSLPNLIFYWEDLCMYDRLIIWEGEVKELKLVIENVGSAPTTASIKFNEESNPKLSEVTFERNKEFTNFEHISITNIEDEDYQKSIGTELAAHPLLRDACVFISNDKLESNDTLHPNDIEKFFAEKLRNQKSSLDIPEHSSVMLYMYVLGCSNHITGNVCLNYHLDMNENTVIYSRTLIIPLNVEIRRRFEIKDINIINAEPPLKAGNSHERKTDLYEGIVSNEINKDNYQSNAIVTIYIRNLLSRRQIITFKVKNDEDRLESSKFVVLNPREEKLVLLLISKTVLPRNLFYNDIPAAVRHVFLTKNLKTSGDDFSNEVLKFWIKSYLTNDFSQTLRQCISLGNFDQRAQLIKGRISAFWKDEYNVQGELFLSLSNFDSIYDLNSIVKSPIAITCTVFPQLSEETPSNLSSQTNDFNTPTQPRNPVTFNLELNKPYILCIEATVMPQFYYKDLCVLLKVDIEPITYPDSAGNPKDLEMFFFSGTTCTIISINSSPGDFIHKIGMIPLYSGNAYVNINVKNLALTSTYTTHLNSNDWHISKRLELSVS